jgi:hypothetical protein
VLSYIFYFFFFLTSFRVINKHTYIKISINKFQKNEIIIILEKTIFNHTYLKQTVLSLYEMGRKIEITP